ncbi:hypothetical protein ABK040_009627 [Willaertia magna]
MSFINPDMLTSKTTKRVQMLLNHLIPIVQQVFSEEQKEKQTEKQIESKETTQKEIYIPIKIKQQYLLENKPWNSIFINDYPSSINEYESELLNHLLQKQELNKNIKLTNEELQTIFKLTLYALENNYIKIIDLNKLNLSGKLNKIDNEILNFKILPKLNFIKEINISGIENINDDTLKAIGNYLPYLEKLNISNTNISDIGCKEMFEKMKNPNILNSLDLSFTKITNNSLNSLLKRLQQVKHNLNSNLNNNLNDNNLNLLNLNGIYVNEDLAFKFLKLLKKLNKIEFGKNETFTKFRNDIILKLPKNCNEYFNSLTLSNKNLTENIVKNILFIYGNPNVKELYIDSNEINEDSLRKVLFLFREKLGGLESVYLNGKLL